MGGIGMAKAAKVLLIIAFLLIIWGVADLYNCATTGKEVLEYYNGAQIIKELVNYNFVQGLIKTILGLLTIVVSFVMRRKSK